MQHGAPTTKAAPRYDRDRELRNAIQTAYPHLPWAIVDDYIKAMRTLNDEYGRQAGGG